MARGTSPHWHPHLGSPHRRSGTRWNLRSFRLCMPIRTGWMVGPSSFAEYQPQTMSYGQEVPLGAVQSSCINAELVFRGSQVQVSLTVALPRPSPGASTGDVRRRRPARLRSDRSCPLIAVQPTARTATEERPVRHVAMPWSQRNRWRASRPSIRLGAAATTERTYEQPESHVT